MGRVRLLMSLLVALQAHTWCKAVCTQLVHKSHFNVRAKPGH